MEIKNSFEIPLPPDDAWNVLMDIPRIAPCMPGAELTGQTADDEYQGKVSVRLGPVALSFGGVATFVERDDTAKHAKVKAQGSDQKGRGAASGLVSFQLSPSGQGSRIDLTTEVTLTGLVAQYGRGAGVIQGVANEICRQFAENLRATVAAPPAPAAAGPGAASVRTPPAAAAKPIGGFGLAMKLLWQSISRLWSRS